MFFHLLKGGKNMHLGSSFYLKSVYPNNEITYLPNANGLMLMKLELYSECISRVQNKV